MPGSAGVAKQAEPRMTPTVDPRLPAVPGGPYAAIRLHHYTFAGSGISARGAAVSAMTSLGTTPSRVAVAWTLLNPAVTAPIVGLAVSLNWRTTSADST